LGKTKRSIGKTLLYYNNGKFLLGIFTGVFSYATFVKVYNLPFWLNYVIVPAAIVITVVGGYLYDKLGIRQAYDQEATKYFKVEIKDEQRQV
jgi:hypothetical protein